MQWLAPCSLAQVEIRELTQVCLEVEPENPQQICLAPHVDSRRPPIWNDYINYRAVHETGTDALLSGEIYPAAFISGLMSVMPILMTEPAGLVKYHCFTAH